MKLQRSRKADRTRLVVGIIGLTALSVVAGLLAAPVVDWLVAPAWRQLLTGVPAGLVVVPLAMPMLRWVHAGPAAAQG